MHRIQERLLNLITKENIGNLSLRKIGELIDENLPQKVKHHLSQLERKGFITIDNRNKKILRSNIISQSHNTFITIPILGEANCGAASIYADENIDGFLKLSKSLLGKREGIFAIKAQGSSLNQANIKGKNVEAGDFVIIDSTQTSPKDGDYVLSIIDNLANIKKYRRDSKNDRIVLLSESTQTFNPIFIHKNDNFRINGKVVDVIKRFEE